ncbi:DUF1772 domain-containing protein [Modestobacter italicus]|uniref:DUF1772 domain-containing protein n=1 Tax=Modestobacter italicus (strain DSM 44449 / CECT 9708 / BC 501) TaxID=2732864 RepID=UPI001C96B99F|nr:DUF1772 domain-containing protein [Modestobacter italicus]
MTALLAAQLALAAAYAGVQWTVRVLVYPQFTAVPADAWPAFHDGHSRRVARVVGPLFAGQTVTTGWLLLELPSGAPRAAVLAGAACLGTVLCITALIAVPQHRRLGRGFDAAAHRRLLHADSVRVLAATGSVLAAGWAALG